MTKLVRVTRIALWVNAVLHLIGSIAMVADHGGSMARRSAAAGGAVVVMFVLVSRRLEKDPVLIALPWAFVLCNFSDTLLELGLSRDPNGLKPIIPELAFLTIYSLFALRALPRKASA